MSFILNFNLSHLIFALTVLAVAVYVYENDRKMLKLKEEVERLKSEKNESPTELQDELKDKENIKSIQSFELLPLIQEEVKEVILKQSDSLSLIQEELNKVKTELLILKQPESPSLLQEELNKLKKELVVFKLQALEPLSLFQEELNKVKKELVISKHPGPAFNVMFKETSPYIKLSTNRKVLKFDDVLLNRGGGYNPSTGVYTVPVTGTYIFSYTVRSYITPLHCYLWKNNTIIGLVYVFKWGTGTYQKVIVLSKGDQLFTMYAYHSSGAKIQTGIASSFSGVFISG